MTGAGALRVLVVLPGLNGQGGAEQSFVVTAPLLQDLGVELELALLTDRRLAVPDVEAAGVRVHDLSGARGLPGRARALTELVRRFRPDLVHATLFEAESAASLAVLTTRTPLLVTWATTTQTSVSEGGVAPWKLKVVEAEQMALGRLARTRYHAINPGVAASRRSTVRVPAERVRVAERGRDPGRYQPLPASELERTRAELGLEPSDRVVLALSRQEPAKGLERLVDMVDPMVEEDPGVLVLVAGREGTATGALQRRIAGIRHPERIRLLGHRTDVPALLQVSDVAVCTSHREGGAIAMVEAWASSCPVAIVPLDGLEGVFVDGRNAVVRPAGELGAAITGLLADPELSARLVAGGLETFRERFTVERSAERLAEVYRWAATRGRDG